MIKTRQITVAVKGNSFGNQYARDGQSQYYSTWILKIKTDDNTGWFKDYDATLKSCNLEKEDIPQKLFDNYEEIKDLIQNR